METRKVYEKLDLLMEMIQLGFMERSYGMNRIMEPDNVTVSNYEDPNEVQLHDELHSVFAKLEAVYNTLSYLKLPIVGTGWLYRNEQDRYELPDGTYFTSGDAIEVLVEENGVQRWVATRVEHDGEDYYLMYGHMRLDGLMARYRKPM